MRFSTKKPIYLLFLLPYFFLSCSKKEIEEIIVEVAPEYSWKASSIFVHKYKIQTNSYADESNFYLLGFEGFSEIYYEGETELVKSYSLFTKGSLEYKFPVTATLFPSTAQNMLSFISSSNPTTNGAGSTLNMVNVDPTFVKFDFPDYETGECIGLTKNNVALVPYQVNTSVISGSKLLLVRLEAKNATYEPFTISETKIIDNLRNDQVKYIQTFENYFYVCFRSGKFVRISEDGTIEEIMEKPLFPIFKHTGSLYGFSNDGFYKSATGKEWNLVAGRVSDDDDFLFQLQRLRYHTLSNDLLIATYNSQLFKVELSQSELRLVELDNSGLEGNKITSIARYKDKVYLTTLSGVFHREESEFLTPKEK